MEFYLLVNKIMAEWRLDVYQRYDDLYTMMSVDKETRWVNDLLNQTEAESKIRIENCETCFTPLEKPRRIGHHTSGRKHGHQQETICPACHKVRTHWQHKWDARWWQPDQPEHVRQGFLLIGLGDRYELMATKLGYEFYLPLAYKFTLWGSILLRRGGGTPG